MEPDQNNQPVPPFDPYGKVEHINPSETQIAKVKRHPFGLILLYVQVILALALAFGLILPFLGDGLESLGFSGDTANLFAVLLLLIGGLFLLVYLVLATRIYQQNQLIITTDNVTQVTQVGLFHRKASEVSMANVEDVTAHKKGIFSTILNYGRLHVETAGEQNNQDFSYCPNPDAYAKAIQDARVTFIKTHGE